MPFSESLAGRLRHALAHERGIEERKMFGGLGFPVVSPWFINPGCNFLDDKFVAFLLSLLD